MLVLKNMKNQEKTWDLLYSKGLAWKKTSKLNYRLKDKSVLELGSGNGKTLKAIIEKNPKHITVIDISKEAIILSKKTFGSNQISYIHSDFLKANFKKKFDVITCYYFLNNLEEEDRVKAARKIVSLLDKNGIILFEDFGVGDMRESGKEIENNTFEKKNGIICHFFDKKEIEILFPGFKTKINEKTLSPVRKDKSLNRKIIRAEVRTR